MCVRACVLMCVYACVFVYVCACVCLSVSLSTDRHFYLNTAGSMKLCNINEDNRLGKTDSNECQSILVLDLN